MTVTIQSLIVEKIYGFFWDRFWFSSQNLLHVRSTFHRNCSRLRVDFRYFQFIHFFELMSVKGLHEQLREKDVVASAQSSTALSKNLLSLTMKEIEWALEMLP